MKKIKDLTEKEYVDLKQSGLMWVIFPESTGYYSDDCKPEPSDVESFISFNGITGEVKESRGIFKNVSVKKTGVGEYSFCDPEPAEPLIVDPVIWETIIHSKLKSICLSMRHDYGLMGPIAKERMLSEATQWIQAISRNLPTAKELQGETDEN